ncbi:hypothetical protein VB002_06680 [Campylobacter concisus]
MKIFYIVVLLSTFLFASEISEAFGDLDGDSKDERVVVWQDSDLHRVLQILKEIVKINGSNGKNLVM